jgi:hypothetical protein
MILVRTDRPCLRVGCHIRLHFPGVVTLLGNGRRVVATIWDHYPYASDGDYGTGQGAVSHDFWVSIISMHAFFFITLVY